MVDKYGIFNAIKVNSIFPHTLAEVCEREKYKMIHITTDCVYSGRDGSYDEKSLHDCTDVYGKTKSLGEPENCTVIRTSIIGEEIGEGRSLIEWIKSMRDKTANGFTNHFWNGLTCLQTVKIFEDIIINNKYWKGVRHVHSPNIVTKLDMVQMVSDVYDLNITINPKEAPEKCDRSMETSYPTFDNIPDIKVQIIEQRDFYPILFGN
jgi:dTDP-4-dehydrorhamnose reductase